MTIKQERVRELIHNHLSQILLFEVTDPALQGVTVTDVRIDRELEYADVWVNALGEEDREGEVIAGLKRANSFLRREVGSRLRIRHVPVLHFHWDRTLAHAQHIESVLDALKEERKAAGIEELPPVIPDELEMDEE